MTAAASSGAEQEPTGARVLIVDDEAPTRILLRKTVQGLCTPCTVFEASDGDEALRIARREHPDLVLLDIVLPGSSSSGVIVCQELCRTHTKVLIVSGNATGPIADACLSMGAVAILRKPFSVDDARAMIGSCLTE